MATSGQMQGSHLNIGGNGGQYFFINWQLAGQDIGGNYSVINWQAYMHFNRADAQLDNGYVDGGGARRWTNGGRIYNYTGNFSTKDIGLASGQFTVGHDGAGNGSFGIGGSVGVYQTGNSGGSQGWSLPTIPRYANIDGFNIDFVTDEAIRFSWHADRGVDYISWWSDQIDGGAHHDEYVGNSQGWFTKELHNLRSNRQYSIRVAVRNAASGLWMESNVAYRVTKGQSSFIAFL